MGQLNVPVAPRALIVLSIDRYIMVVFQSTRSHTQHIDFFEAIFANLCPDGGLYSPVDIPHIDYSTLKSLNFSDLAQHIAIHYDERLRYTSAAYRQIYPFQPYIRKINSSISLLELFHGPTCAFKDFGVSFLAHVMEERLTATNSKALILTATSGDTGSAVAHAFHRKTAIRVVILYPAGKISDLQEQQISALGDNITAVKIDGTFDDCQRLVKCAFQDKALSVRLHLTSANSINIGRLLPQSFYYYFAYQQIRKEHNGPLYFCVPSGNFGNLTSGIIAARSGLPVDGFIAVTNKNRIVPRYIKSGRFRPRRSQATISNAMDVGNPSNFERLIAIYNRSHEKLRREITGYWVSDRATRQTISRLYRHSGQIVDPHTATGLYAAQRMLHHVPRTAHIITLATAHPCKFSEVITPLIDAPIPFPAHLQSIIKKEKQFITLPAHEKKFKRFLINNYA